MAKKSTLNFNGTPIRTLKKSGQTWLVAVDVANALGYASCYKVYSLVDEDQKKLSFVPSFNGGREMIVITKAGAYQVAAKSTKPNIEKFVRWLEDVIPFGITEEATVYSKKVHPQTCGVVSGEKESPCPPIGHSPNSLDVCGHLVKEQDGLYSMMDAYNMTVGISTRLPRFFVDAGQTKLILDSLHKVSPSRKLIVKKELGENGYWCCQEVLIAYSFFLDLTLGAKIFQLFIEREGRKTKPAENGPALDTNRIDKVSELLIELGQEMKMQGKFWTQCK